MKAVIIFGSSRSNGHTRQICSYLQEISGLNLIDLKEKNIAQYDYDYQNRDDDFLPLMRHLLANYDTLIFATPVYWYSMSGIMKTFFDRITDCLKIEKDLGQKLKGKNMAVLSCSGHDDLDEHFSMPFVNSAEYLGMNFLGEMHTWISGGVMTDQMKQKVETFWNMINHNYATV